MSEPTLVPVTKTSTTEAVVAQLQTMIINQEFAAGDPLPAERELSASLAVSRNVVREAIGILGQRGLVRVEHGRGTFVAAPSSDSIRDSLSLLLALRHVSLIELCDVRLLIEPELARLAAKNATASTTATLTHLMEELERGSADPDQHVHNDIAFHNEVARLAQQSVLGSILEAIQAPMHQSMALGLLIPDSIRESDVQHRAMHDAIVRGDESGATIATREHIAYVRTYIAEVAG